MNLLHRHILLPAFETLYKGRSTFRYLRELDRSQWLPPAHIQALQFRALQNLVTHAFENSPFYRQEWTRLGLHPRLLQHPADLHRWPILDRDTTRQHRQAMLATNIRGPLITKNTGGTSGSPLQVDLDQRSNDKRTAASYRGYAWAGAAPGTRQLYLWGSPLGARSRRARLKDGVYHALHRRTVVSCLDTSPDLHTRFLNALERVRPDVVVAYTNPLYEVARRLEESRTVPAHRPRSIIIGAEKIYPFQRELIERALGAPVFETYGSREFMLIAAECERHAGLHLTSENLLVEILDDDGRPTPDGAEGNIVITDLFNYAMPFVRYAIGDRATAGFGTCPCGRGLPLLQGVIGRRLDLITSPSGRVIPGEFFVYLVKDFPAIRRYQILQEEPARIRFALAAESLPERERLRFESLVRQTLGPDLHVDFVPVEQIPLTPAGKLQVVINRLHQRSAA